MIYLKDSSSYRETYQEAKPFSRKKICDPLDWVVFQFHQRRDLPPKVNGSISDPSKLDFLKKTFVISGQGNFDHQKYAGLFPKALERAEALFDKIVREAPEPQEWHRYYQDYKKKRTAQGMWQQMNGTCFGNVMALATAILKEKRCLTIREMRKIERGSSFVEESLYFQTISSIIWSAKKVFREETAEKQKEIIKSLQREQIEETEKVRKFVLHVKEMIDSYFPNYQFPQEESRIQRMENEELEDYVVDYLWRSWTRNIVQDFFSLHELGVLLSSPQLNQYEWTISAQDTKFFFLEPFRPNFQGIACIEMTTGANAETALSHAFLVQIDNQRKRYVSYDASFSYHRWKNWESFDTELLRLAQAYQYRIIRCSFGVIQGELLSLL